MGNIPLVELRPGSGLDTGVFPTAEPTSGPVWRDVNNAWFRKLSLSHILGRTKVVNSIGRAAKAMTQAFADGETRLYYEDLGLIYKWDGVLAPVLIGELDPEGDYDLEPFGTWLLATDNVDAVKLWKNDLPNTFIDIGTTQFASGKIIKKLAQRVLVYATDVLPAGVYYSKPSDPETWDPVIASVITGAGNLPFRNIDSEIIAVTDLAGAHGVYTEDKLLILEYLGESLRFGVPRQPIAGIGAASKDSVIARGARNYGLFEGGVFVTDGTSFKMLDDPAMSDWLRTEVDWARGNEIVGYYDKKLLCNVWSVPLRMSTKIGITLDDEGKFGFIDGIFSSALEQEIFDAPFVALSDGIYKASQRGTVLGNFAAGTHLLDAGDKGKYKAWDFALFDGTLSGQVRFGYTDTPSLDGVTWTAWETLNNRVPLVPTESIFLAIQFASDEELHISGVKIYGSTAGLVI